MAERKDMPDTEKFSVCTYYEARTGSGQVLRITGSREGKEAVITALSEVKTLDFPVAHAVSIGQGAYGTYSRYRIQQHKYAGGGHPGNGGYIEVLEVQDPPEGRCGVILYEYTSGGGGTFSEWKNLPNALSAFEKLWGMDTEKINKRFSKLEGFIRCVKCGPLVPWFYAVGDQELIGDFVFPEHIQEDSFFRFGRKFIFEDEIHGMKIKTCLGCRSLIGKYDTYPYKPYTYRLVFWDDGTSTSYYEPLTSAPRPMEDGDLWIEEAMLRFRQLLAGKRSSFTISFADGTVFQGKISTHTSKRGKIEGRYDVSVVFADGESKSGFVDFEPTPKFRDVFSFIRNWAAMQGKTVLKIKAKLKAAKEGGKRWSGVEFNRDPVSVPARPVQSAD